MSESFDLEFCQAVHAAERDRRCSAAALRGAEQHACRCPFCKSQAKHIAEFWELCEYPTRELDRHILLPGECPACAHRAEAEGLVFPLTAEFWETLPYLSSRPLPDASGSARVTP